MVNKLWCEKTLIDGTWEYYDDNYRKELLTNRQYIQEMINLYCPELFQVPEDITPDNFQDFLEVLLVQCQYYNITLLARMNFADAISLYLYGAYKDEFPETSCPRYPEDDRRELVFSIFFNCFESTNWLFLPEEVPFLLECLNAPEEQIVLMQNKLEVYFCQFDAMKRCNSEMRLRQEVLRIQRKKALEQGDPIPIRPMVIELDMCYKDGTAKSTRGKLWEYVFLNYSHQLRNYFPESYTKLLFGGEVEAVLIIKECDGLFINRCSICQDIKYSPKANECLSCGISSKPLLTKK